MEKETKKTQQREEVKEEVDSPDTVQEILQQGQPRRCNCTRCRAGHDRTGRAATLVHTPTEDIEGSLCGTVGEIAIPEPLGEVDSDEPEWVERMDREAKEEAQG